MTLLDTNTVIYYLKGYESVISRFRAASPRELAIPAVVAYELEYGTLRIGTTRRRDLVTNLLRALTHVPFDYRAALQSAHIRFELERQGESIGPIDLLIAGTALSRSAVLVTSNTKEFSRVKGLRLADWAAPFPTSNGNPNT